MTSPRTLASRSAILALLLACAFAVASATPGPVETSALEIRAKSRKLSETLRSSLTPEIRSALGERIARGRPEPNVRGRSLAQEKICQWSPCGDDDYDDCLDCHLQPSVVYRFKPATPKGREGFDVLEPIVTCMEIESADECRMKPSCIYRADDDFCDGDFDSLLTAPVPANACTEAEKTPVTIYSLVMREQVACQKFETSSTCNNAKGLTCEWSDDEGRCNIPFMSFFMDLITGSAKDLHTILALGRQADTCATQTSSGTCAGESGCSWNSAGTPALCDVADATVKSVAGVETLTGVFSTWNTCQKLETSSSCQADSNCKWVKTRASDGTATSIYNCELTSAKASAMLVDGMSAGAFKTFISEGTYCTNTRASDGTTGSTSMNQCYAAGKIDNNADLPNSADLPGACLIFDEFKHTVAGKAECFYWPGQDDEDFFMDIITAPYPGYDKRCPIVMDQVTTKNDACDKATTKAACGVGDYKDCKWSKDDEGAEACEYDFDNIWKLVVGEEDGVNLLSIFGSCGDQKSETACAAHTRDIDFFGLKYPELSKVKTTLGFLGLDTMDKTKAETLQKAVADAVGGDVKAEEIAIKGVQFPVESKIELSKSKSAVDADRAGFETKFKTGLAEDLGVLPSNIVVKDIKEASRRRRGLLASNIEVDFEVDGAPDSVRAKAIAKQVESAGGLSTLGTNTGATPTVPAGTTATVELRVEVEPISTDPNGVATKLNAATIVVDGITAKHETKATVEKNTAEPVSAANGVFSAAGAFLAAIASVLVLA